MCVARMRSIKGAATGFVGQFPTQYLITNSKGQVLPG